MSTFKKAQRIQAKLKIMISGPSGGGKTYSALRLASGLGKKIAVIDTENGSASLYAKNFEFDVLEIQPPYTIQKYTQALQAADKEGYEVVIVDSTTHAWAGDGGLLSKKEALDARGGNSFTNWAGISKEHTQFVAALLHSPFHLIATVRSKQEYVIEQNDKGKSAPRKVGLAPIQRDGLEYEFTTVFDVAMDHNAQASKDRTGLFDGHVFQISEKTGHLFTDWLNGGEVAPVPPAHQEVEAPKIQKPVSVPSASGPSQPQIKRLFAISKDNHWTQEQVKTFLKDVYRLESTSGLGREQYDDFCKTMELFSYEQAMDDRLSREAQAPAS